MDDVSYNIDFDIYLVEIVKGIVLSLYLILFHDYELRNLGKH
jgi:hypothetical protein